MSYGSDPRLPILKVIAACVAVGLHLAVLAAVMLPAVETVSLGTPESEEVLFVELGPSVDEALASVAPAIEPAPGHTPPEPVVEPPPPEPVVEPPPAEPALKPAPTEPEVTLKPKPKPKPAVKLKAPRAEARPETSHPAQAPAAQAGESWSAVAPQGQPVALDPDRPRTIGRIDYLGARPQPVYPRASQRRGEHGRVVLRVLISPEGRVAHASVHQSSGHERLDGAALDAIRAARFRPYTENGIAYKALVDIPFDFVL